MEVKIKAIFLHGTGSVGKTTIAKALQEILDEPYWHVGFDFFVSMIPPAYLPGGKKAEEGISFKIDSVQKNTVSYVGSAGKKFLLGVPYAIAGLAKQGNNVIIDEIFTNQARLNDYLLALDFCKVFHVGIFAPLEVIEQREKMRGDRMQGQAKNDFESVHLEKKYDITVDTGKLSPQQCALAIKNFIKEHN